MANTVTSQTLIDGDRNLVMLFTGLLDTSNEARVAKVTLSGFLPIPTRVRVDRIAYSFSGTLVGILDWDATTPVRFLSLSGQGEICARPYGGLVNNAGAGITGNIAFTTAGWATGTLGYTMLLEMVKGSF